MKFQNIFALRYFFFIFCFVFFVLFLFLILVVLFYVRRAYVCDVSVRVCFVYVRTGVVFSCVCSCVVLCLRVNLAFMRVVCVFYDVFLCVLF